MHETSGNRLLRAAYATGRRIPVAPHGLADGRTLHGRPHETTAALPFLAVLPLHVADDFPPASIGPHAAGCTTLAPRLPAAIAHANALAGTIALVGVLPINDSKRTSCDKP